MIGYNGSESSEYETGDEDCDEGEVQGGKRNGEKS
jgi:hypothetical protein